MESIFHVPRFKLIHMEDIVCISYTLTTALQSGNHRISVYKKKKNTDQRLFFTVFQQEEIERGQLGCEC